MSNFREVNFHYINLEGSAYQIGLQQAKIAKRTPAFKNFLSSGRGHFSTQEFSNGENLMERFCPGIIAEIQGLADGLDVPIEDIIFFNHSYLLKGNCSHFVVDPSKTVDHQILVGRSYEFGDIADDLRLCNMKVDNKNRLIGSSTLLFGFNEGINEKGLVVTMSAGGIPVGLNEGMTTPIQDGLQFWVAIRALLECCDNVSEALDLVKEIPFAGNPNLILADKTGNAALVEIFGTQKEIIKLDLENEKSFIHSTNHYTLNKMQTYNKPGIRNHSQVRFDQIQTFLSSKDVIDKASVKYLLSSKYPDGLCSHYYDEFFGTLRSMVFDPTSSEIDICFGSPAVNTWHKINFSSPSEIFPAKLPLEKTSPDFWKILEKR
ncbi:MAG: hypothetical protein JEZ06_14905 [Anaerolineaceae bacterium]|nr:hypothetical protein [Anaerolineaceae bacterium]